MLNVEEDVELLNVEEDVELLNVEEDVELLNVEEDVELLNVEEDVELLNVGEDVELLNVEDDVELLNVEDDVELLNVKEDVELLNVEEDVELLNVEENVELLVSQVFHRHSHTSWIVLREGFRHRTNARVPGHRWIIWSDPRQDSPVDQTHDRRKNGSLPELGQDHDDLRLGVHPTILDQYALLCLVSVRSPT